MLEVKQDPRPGVRERGCGHVVSPCAASARLSPTGTTALAGLDLDIAPGEFVSLLGPSGCGKSTALRIIAGLAEPTSGSVAWPGADGRGPSRRYRLRVPGADADALGARSPTMSGCRCACAASPKRGAARRGSRSASRSSASRGFKDAYPRELSGGMKMRVSIARALSLTPEAPAHGRALRRARRDHPASSSTTTSCAFSASSAARSCS